MSAQDNMNETQFYSLRRVGMYRSPNLPSMTVEDEYQDKVVNGHWGDADQCSAKSRGFDSAEAYQQSLTDHISHRGIQNPVTHSGEYMVNGFHRYAAARTLHHSQMAVQEHDPEAGPLPLVKKWKGAR